VTGGAAAWGAALLRATLGVIFVMHGYLALYVLGPHAAAGYIVRMGYPAWLSLALAWYLILVHGLGGLLLILGLWTRVVALLQTPIMASALFLLHLAQGFFMRATLVDSPAGPRAVAVGYEYSLLVLVATLVLALLGPGACSVDGRRATPRFKVP
jgi:putative oxidoreductase